MAPEEKPLIPSADAVEEQLARILASHDFVSSPCLSAFLQFVVGKTLAQKSEEVKEYTVGTEVFNRPKTFDPRLDTIVRVQASKLRSRLTEYYSTTGAHDPIVIELPRGSYVPVIRRNGVSANDSATKSVAAPAVPPARRQTRAWIISVLCGICLLVITGLYGLRAVHRPVPLGAIRFTLPPPENTSFLGWPSLSPNGRHILIPISTPSGSSALWLRSLDAASGQLLPGTEGAGMAQPVWSQDGRFALFLSTRTGRINKIEIPGAKPPEVVPGTPGFGIAWDGQDIVVLPQEGSGLAGTSATGGETFPITQLDNSRQEIAHYWPQFLSDTRHILFFARSRIAEENAIYAVSLNGKRRKHLLTSESRAQYVSAPRNSARRSGYLLYVKKGTLFAHPFDLNKLEFSGDPKPIVSEVAQAPYGQAAFAVSETGTLVYLSGFTTGGQLTWFNRSGKQLGTAGPPGLCGDPAISPDGKHVAFDYAEGANRDVWIADVASGHARRLTFDGEVDHMPVWAPDGSRIAFDSHRSGLGDLYVRASTGISSETRLLPWIEYLGPDDWSRDNRFIAFTSWAKATKSDIWILPLEKGGQPLPYLQSGSHEQLAAFSPDGRWIAYVSDESGRQEVYVQAFDGISPASGGKSLVSVGGGSQPVWRANGTELFYLAPDNSLMAIDVTTKGTFTSGRPKRLFGISPLIRWGPRNDYDVSPDGQRFLIRLGWQPNPPTPINVFVDWAAVLKD